LQKLFACLGELTKLTTLLLIGHFKHRDQPAQLPQTRLNTQPRLPLLRLTELLSPLTILSGLHHLDVNAVQCQLIENGLLVFTHREGVCS
jgi:hypothetical protein